MSEFEDAVTVILANEGGLVDDEKDPGGLTNYGISLRFLTNTSGERLRQYGIVYNDQEHLKDLLKTMSPTQAKAIYKGEFWDAANYGSINNQHVVNYIFDMVVNMGPAEAIKCSQRAIWAWSQRSIALLDDGILGKTTVGAINQVGLFILAPLRSERSNFYRMDVLRHPDKQKFLDGWLKRTYSF